MIFGGLSLICFVVYLTGCKGKVMDLCSVLARLYFKKHGTSQNMPKEVVPGITCNCSLSL